MKLSSIRNNYWFLLLTCLFVQCHDECIVQGNCTLEPNSGLCLAHFTRYYYDQQEKRCKEFTWGGCGGVVPYETLADCQSDCDCH